MGSSALSSKTYHFDEVFSPAADQSMIFDDVVTPILGEVRTDSRNRSLSLVWRNRCSKDIIAQYSLTGRPAQAKPVAVVSSRLDICVDHVSY